MWAFKNLLIFNNINNQASDRFAKPRVRIGKIKFVSRFPSRCTNKLYRDASLPYFSRVYKSVNLLTGRGKREVHTLLVILRDICAIRQNRRKYAMDIRRVTRTRNPPSVQNPPPGLFIRHVVAERSILRRDNADDCTMTRLRCVEAISPRKVRPISRSYPRNTGREADGRTG